jgi:hypothetical protein
MNRDSVVLISGLSRCCTGGTPGIEPPPALLSAEAVGRSATACLIGRRTEKMPTEARVPFNKSQEGIPGQGTAPPPPFFRTQIEICPDVHNCYFVACNERIQVFLTNGHLGQRHLDQNLGILEHCYISLKKNRLANILDKLDWTS